MLKFIVLPLLRTLGLNFIIFVWWPVCWCGLVVMMAWDWRYGVSSVRDFLRIPFLGTADVTTEPDEPSYYYRTAFDWYFDKKTFV